MNILIIGAEGFVGNHLIDRMINIPEWNLHATYLFDKTWNNPSVIGYKIDITDESSLTQLIKNIQPTYIIHLAAQSSVSVSWKNPKQTVNININGTINLLNAVKSESPHSRVLLIGSSEEYGRVNKEDNPIKEDRLVNPENIYALTKAAQNQLGKIYSKAFGLDIIMTRSFNHFGPGQLETFVVSDFCKQIVAIENGEQSPEIFVGNLEAYRDFTDVRDITEAYLQLLKYGESGQTYNVGSGKAIQISEILNKIIKSSNATPKITIDKSKYRPIDVPLIVADTSKLKSICNWNPIFNLEQSLYDTILYWRNLN